MDNFSAHNNNGDLELPNVKIIKFIQTVHPGYSRWIKGIIADLERYFKTLLVRHVLLGLISIYRV